MTTRKEQDAHQIIDRYTLTGCMTVDNSYCPDCRRSRRGINSTCPRCKSNFRALDGHTMHPLCSGCMDLEYPGWDNSTTE